MTDSENSNLDSFRDRQPFRVPEKYFERFTGDFMSRLPQKTAPETKVIRFYDRVKPWLYLAAMFAGAVILFNIYNKPSVISKSETKAIIPSVNTSYEDVDDAVFLDMMEDMHVDKYMISFIYDLMD